MGILRILALIAAVIVVAFALFQKKIMGPSLCQQFTEESVDEFCKRTIPGILVFALGLLVEVFSKSDITFWLGLVLVICGAILSGRASKALEEKPY